jgi:hypothetical protein
MSRKIHKDIKFVKDFLQNIVNTRDNIQIRYFVMQRCTHFNYEIEKVMIFYSSMKSREH